MKKEQNENPVVAYSSIEKIVLGKAKTPLVIVLCPNYEDRSRAIAQKINSFAEKSTRQIRYLMVCLKNKKNNDMILEDLKESNIKEVSSVLNISDESIEWLDYPNDFSSNALKSLLEHVLNESTVHGEYTDMLFDISTMPKSIIFHLCEHIETFINAKNIGKIFFAYAQPQIYSKVHYAQDVGILKGMFSGKILSFDNNQSIHAVIFPSRTGHEGKLLCDSLDNLNRSPSYNIYFPIHAAEFNSSLEIMRANQSLLDREAYNSYFYCSLQDAIKELDDYFKNERLILHSIAKQGSTTPGGAMKQTYVVAPFGAKIFVPVAYFELLRLKNIAPQLIDIEICHVKGFQYTSVYSIGMGNITCFELRWKDK